MKPEKRTAWRRKALAVLPLAVLFLSPAVGADEREQRGETQEPRQEVGQASELIGASNRAGIFSELSAEAGGQVRQVKPDPARQRQLSGPVVEMEARTLYVEDSASGAVVPFDVSALQFREQPEEGQEVRVTYQVEDETDNVAVGLDGAVDPPAPK
jgi:RNase P/RNase MRP subunit p29